MNATHKKVVEFFAKISIDESVDVNEFLEAIALNVGLYTALKIKTVGQREVTEQFKSIIDTGLKIANSEVVPKRVSFFIIKK
ncbi:MULTISPECIES: hypothetical protein [Paenibacillus]|jgi:hypothetical protein|uniref:hypothetical protein n=1 Tax=Paenibacillus TaxID=44249 RepID=UPI0004114684|nr:MULTISPECIES: hypothetical protein [Paenibacillus]UMY55332.1 hypothetical protein MLD56_02415 [Paenibacillus peoriae]